MHLLLFSGFLGSGKTTLAVQVAQAVVERGKRVAILVNEIGEAGIDNQLMRQLDLNVWELLNGCICCTLSADLVSTLQKLDADYAPDLVLIEPSGAADPHSVLHALPYYRGRPLESQRCVTILDPLRLHVLIEVMTPLIHSQIQNADFILIGKSDLAQSEELETALQIARTHNPFVDVVCADLTAGLTPELLSQVVPWLS
ncbi:MAG: GTP-binding protein [Chloroflexi bacterium]|jgi:G3E family GTPase|nr:GTP-binding protein [Chloroflexota bacterium]